MAVDFRNGQLSIVADDAELGKVLHQIAEETGASVEVAPEISNERVIAHLGPGPAAEIVSTLLSSPRIGRPELDQAAYREQKSILR
jgi:enhancing lycopene biosynthesis protein 2